MAAIAKPAYSAERSHDLAQQLRILRAVARTEFKLKYADSALGYVWSVLKPLGLFTMLYIVFGRFFRLNTGFSHFPLYLLIGIVLWTFFADGTLLSLTSITHRGALLRKLAFPHTVVPVSVILTVGITFCVNIVVVALFVAANGIVPRPEWLLIVPLLAEVFLFTLGVGLFLAALNVRFGDAGQVWELLLQLIFYASPIIYPVGFLPPWWKPVAFLSPFVQAMQDIRALILPGGPALETAATVYGTAWGRLLPITVGAVLLVGGYVFFRRESPWFAERV